MLSRSIVRVGSVGVLIAVTAFGCASQQAVDGMARTDTAIQDQKNLPKWVTQKGAAFSGEKRVFYGVGSAAALQNPALRRRAAEGQARRDIAQTMQTYVAALQKQYMSETTAGDMSKQSVEQQVTDTMKQMTEATLVGAQIVEYWEHPTRNEAYALARLDLEQFLDVMKSYHAAAGQSKELNAKVREYVQKNAAKAYDELNQEVAKKNGGTAAVAQAPTAKKSSGRDVLAAGEWRPMTNGRVDASRAIEAGSIEAGALVTMAYEDLVAVANGQNLARLSGASVEIGAQDLVEITYQDLVWLASTEDVGAAGRVTVEGAKGASSKSGGVEASVSQGRKPATYVWVNKTKAIEAGFWDSFTPARPTHSVTAVAAVRG